MSNNKIVVPRIGKSAFSTNPNDFIFHSDYNTFKILAQGVVSHTITASTDTTKTIAHGQSNIPFVFIFIKWADGYTSMPLGIKKGASHVLFLDLYCTDYYIDGTNITLKFHNSTGSDEVLSIAYLVCEAPTTAN